MLVKLNVTLKPNWIENIIKSNETTPDSFDVKPAREKSTLLKKNSRTTLSGRIHPNNSPRRVPRMVPKNKINTTTPIERLFIIYIFAKTVSPPLTLSPCLTQIVTLEGTTRSVLLPKRIKPILSPFMTFKLGLA